MVEVVAPAKLTLSFRVTGVRADGYHLVDAEMVSVDLVDRLTVRPGSTGLTVGGPFATGVPTDGTNLVARALQVSGRTAAVHILKQIPSGGGLGGGSSDAAAILAWAGVRDLAVAVGLGADVAFCLHGGRARVRGIGDEIDPLPFDAADYTLVTPPIHADTAAVYRAWDAMGGPTGEGANDLETAALAVVPELRRWRERIGRLSGATPTLAGSGSTWFVPGRDDALAALTGEGAAVVAVRTVAARTFD